MSRRFCFALDLKDDPALIAEYRKYHEKIWPEITQGLKHSGIEDLEIYLLGARMFMIMEVNESFSSEKKAKAEQNKRSADTVRRGISYLSQYEQERILGETAMEVYRL
jgi:L-rhamnose mutarotase